MKKLIAGNWKMNASLAGNETLVNELRAGIGAPACDVAICVPSPYFEKSMYAQRMPHDSAGLRPTSNPRAAYPSRSA